MIVYQLDVEFLREKILMVMTYKIKKAYKIMTRQSPEVKKHNFFSTQIIL
jgi:hypothetical protein